MNREIAKDWIEIIQEVEIDLEVEEDVAIAVADVEAVTEVEAVFLVENHLVHHRKRVIIGKRRDG